MLNVLNYMYGEKNTEVNFVEIISLNIMYYELFIKTRA